MNILTTILEKTTPDAPFWSTNNLQDIGADLCNKLICREIAIVARGQNMLRQAMLVVKMDF